MKQRMYQLFYNGISCLSGGEVYTLKLGNEIGTVHHMWEAQLEIEATPHFYENDTHKWVLFMMS